MNKFLKQLSNDKFKIGNQRNEKGLIPMKLFLSFLTVEVSKNSDCLGSSNGWTQHRGNNNLIISGGIVRGCEYLDSIKYKKNLDNVYNDFVNPFYIFDIMNDDGKEFFLKYHADNIQAEIGKAKANATIAGRKYRQACADRVDLVDFWAELQGYIR